MDKVEALRLALAELGEASDEQVVSFARERFGVVIDLKYMPVVRATLKDRQLQAEFRQRAAEGAGAGSAASAG